MSMLKQMFYSTLHGTIFFSLYWICVQCDYVVSDTNIYGIEWQYNIIPFTPELIFLYVFLILFIYSFINKMSRFDCVVAYIAIVNMVIVQYQRVLQAPKVSISNKLWYNDPCSINIKMAIFILILIVLIFMFVYSSENDEVLLNFENMSIIFLCAFGILIFITSNHLFVMYLGIELQSLALYILCCLKRFSNKSLEAGFKYYLYGSFSSAVLLFGISLLYGIFGSLNYKDVCFLINVTDFIGLNNMLLHFSLICILIAFLFKLAIFPFHWWLADIYEGSADIITFFLAIVPKLPFFYVLYKLFLNIFSKYILYVYLLTFCGVMSIIIGTILALYEIKLKKLLAYSSIVHMGYIIIAMAVGSKIGIIVSLYYFLIYIVVTIYIFSIFLVTKLLNNNTFRNVTDFVYLRNHNKWLSMFAIVALLSLAGIPPFIGFYGKLYIFYMLIGTGNYYLCMLLMLLSILSCIYYIRLIRFIFFDDKLYQPMVFIKVQPVYLYYIIVCCFFSNLGFLLFQEPILVYILVLFY